MSILYLLKIDTKCNRTCLEQEARISVNIKKAAVEHRMIDNHKL